MRKFIKTKEALKRELLADAALWLSLIIFKAIGIVGISWPAVLSGCVWIPLLMLFLNLPFYLLFMCYVEVKRWWRWRNCREVRINAEDFRLPGETDEQLRARIYTLVAHISVPGSIRFTNGADNAKEAVFRKPVMKQKGDDKVLCCPNCGEPAKLWARDLTKHTHYCVTCGLLLDLSEHIETDAKE